MEEQQPAPMDSANRLKTPEQEARALRERAANERAARYGRPLPYPNPWDALDPTKLPPGSSAEEIEKRVEEFLRLCPPRPRKKHVL